MHHTSNREGTSDFLDKIVDKIAESETGVAKTASTNHPAEKAAATDVIAKTNHPSEKMSKSEETKKVATEEKEATEKKAEEVAAPAAAPVADVSAEKSATEVAPEKVAKTEMTLHEARIARRTGSFVKVAGKVDLYQEAKTNNFWKITGSKVVRAFDEDKGIAVEKK